MSAAPATEREQRLAVDNAALRARVAELERALAQGLGLAGAAA